MMIHFLPEKHVRLSESVIGLGAIVLRILEQEPKSLDSIWSDVQMDSAVKRSIHGAITLDAVVLALDFLFAIGAIHLDKDGALMYATH